MKQQYKNTMLKQQGFSLIEALVAFLVLSIGLLGIASLQLLSVKAGYVAKVNTMAVIKSEEIFERIRSNPTQVFSYISLGGDPGVNHNCKDAANIVNMCSPEEMAQDDIYNWKADVKRSLPANAGTTASIDVVAPIPGVLPVATVTVTINWKSYDVGVKGAATDWSYSASSFLCDNTAC